MGCVYLIAFSSKKYYVGMTAHSVERRIREHECLAFGNGKSKRAVHRAMRVHEYSVSVIFRCENSDHLKMMEIQAIKHFGSLAPGGYNLTSGGDGSLSPSESTRMKLSKAGKGRIHSEETRMKISKANSGKKKSKEHVAKMRELMIGRTWSDERKRKFSEFRKGKKFSDEVKKLMSESAFKRWKILKERK